MTSSIVPFISLFCKVGTFCMLVVKKKLMEYNKYMITKEFAPVSGGGTAQIDR